MKGPGCVLLGVLAACGGAGKTGLGTGNGEDARAVAEDALIQAIGKRDPALVQAMLRAPVDLGGVWFADADCQAQFGAPGQAGADKLPALAKCLAELPLLRSQRKHTLYSSSLFQYDGVEIEVQFRLVGKPTVQRIGYAGRRGSPTVTHAHLEMHRADGDPTAMLPPEAAGAIDGELKAAGREYATAWVELCVDATGAVEGIYPREASSPRTHAAFAAALRTWKFKPIEIGGQATPACALLRLVHPADATVTSEVVPVPYPADNVVRIPLAGLQRTHGTDVIPPDNADKLELDSVGGGTLVSSYQFCIDPTGKVSKVQAIATTGLAGYDRKLAAALASWMYRPLVIDGTPVEACSSVVFVYQQGT